MKTLSINELPNTDSNSNTKTSWFSSIKNSNFLIKLFNWEYWPIWAVYFPVFIYYILLSIRARNPFFFATTNPGMENGGFTGESKSILLEELPDHLVPKGLKFKHSMSMAWIKTKIDEAGLEFPMIVKPDRGQRGWHVKKVESFKELEQYLKHHNIDFILQEFIDLPEEYAVLIFRYPKAIVYRINSVTQKEFLTVTGNGKMTLKELIMAKPRAKLQYSRLKEEHDHELHEIIPREEVVELGKIGNHCKGTMFKNANHLINKKMIAAFEPILKELKGVYFARFDLKCKSVEDLYTGENIKIVEVNGVGAEPAHIYDPKYPLLRGWFDLLKHWSIIAGIARENRKNGHPYSTWKEFKIARAKYFEYRRSAFH